MGEENGEGGGLVNMQVASATALARRKAWLAVVVSLGLAGRDGMGWDRVAMWGGVVEGEVKARERWWCSTWRGC